MAEIQLNNRRPRFLEGQETNCTYEDFRKPAGGFSIQAKTHRSHVQLLADSVLDFSVLEKGEGRRRTMLLIEEREKLPIFKIKESLLKDVREHSALIVVGDTGSGKTTQIPEYLYQDANCESRIGIAMPCALTAIKAAQYVADEFGCPVGERVGYKIRFKDRTGPETVIKYMTESVLWSEITADPELSKYSVIMIDDAHERSIIMDILFGLIKENVLRTRSNFRLIVSSATTEAERLKSYFFDCKVLKTPRLEVRFPVTTVYSPQQCSDPLKDAIDKVLFIFSMPGDGDILLFSPGKEEVDLMVESLRDRVNSCEGTFSSVIIMSALKLPGPACRKVVVADSIGETLLAIEGLRFVVDPGFTTRRVMIHPNLATNTRRIVPISQACAARRALQAGQYGTCHRIYSKASLNEMSCNDEPDILIANLGTTALQMIASGIKDIRNFDFVDPPPPQHVASALRQLYCLGALDENGTLTETGRKMALFPLNLLLSRALIAGVEFKCSDQVLTIVAMVWAGGVYLRSKQGHHLSLLELCEAWKHPKGRFSKFMRRAKHLRDRLVTIMDRNELAIIRADGEDKNVRIEKAIVSGLFFHAARRDKSEKGGYRTLVRNDLVVYHNLRQSVTIHQSEWVVYTELALMDDEKEHMLGVMDINPNLLVELAPRFFTAQFSRKICKKNREKRMEILRRLRTRG